MLFSLTVGQISGVIAAAIFTLQLLLPNALIVLLVGALGERHTLVTWSVVQCNLLSSLWPTILRTDAVASEGVSLKIRLLTWACPLGLALVALAAIVTPLGLYQDISPDRSPQLVPMKYVADSGPFGHGTPPRSTLGFSRSCGAFALLQCPGTTTEIHYDVINSTGSTTYINGTEVVNDDYDMRIPKVLAELYQSGLSSQPGSVSSFFDIQTRAYGIIKVGQKSYHLGESFRYLQSVILNDKLEAVNGLVVDTQTGGVGFRNHTVPVIDGLGAEWYEDILWIEPETACVNNNVSLEMKTGDGSTTATAVQNITLVDNGGFINASLPYPERDLSNTQQDAQLWCRAHKAAWMTNAYSMIYMNVTRPSPKAFSYKNSYIGARFPLTSTQTIGAQLGQIVRSTVFDGLVNPSRPSNYSLVNAPGANYSNPFGISYANYSIISLICSGAGGLDLANITNIDVECGLVFGVPVRKDGSTSSILEPNTEYRQSIYTCASTNRASIKRVHFKYNSTDITDNIRGLRVLDVAPKQYNDNKSMPIWGVEDADFELNDLQQLWGIISEDKVKSVNLSVVQQDHVYLPGLMGLLPDSYQGSQYIPGASGPSSILGMLYSSDYANYLPNFSGITSMAMAAKWQTLSTDETKVPLLLSLIWTDLAANHLLGTRNWNTGNALPSNLQRRDTDTTSPNSQMTPVTIYRSRIRYHWPYAIPALLALVLVSSICIVATITALSSRGGPARIRYFAQHLSSGRLLGSLYHPNQSDREAPTKEWIAVSGKKQSDLKEPSDCQQPLTPIHPPKVDLSEQESFSSSFHEKTINSGKTYERVETEEVHH